MATNTSLNGPDCPCTGCTDDGGGDTPCATPIPVNAASLICNACTNFTWELRGPSPSTAVVYSGPGTGTAVAYPGTYTWTLTGWPAEYTPSASSGTITLACGSIFNFLPFTWSFSTPGAWCPCGSGSPCTSFPPLTTAGSKTLTNARGTATLAPYPASSPLVIHSSGDPDTTYADVWAGTQAITACSVAADCCDTRIEGGTVTPGSYELFWVMGVKSSGGCFLHCWGMACYCGGSVKLVAGSFDRSGLGMSVECGGVDAPTCVKKPVMLMSLSSSGPLAGGVASPFFYQWSPVFQIPSAMFGNILGTSSGGGPCSFDAVIPGYHLEYMGTTTATD